MASRRGRLGIVALCIERGIDVRGVNIWGYTALMMASFNGHADVLDYLLKHGGLDIIDERNSRNDTALDLTYCYGGDDVHPCCTKLLLDAGADPRDDIRGTPLDPNRRYIYEKYEKGRETIRLFEVRRSVSKRAAVLVSFSLRPLLLLIDCRSLLCPLSHPCHRLS